MAMDGKDNLSDFINLVKELKDCIGSGKTGDYQAVKMFEMSDFVERTSKEICSSEHRDEMDKMLGLMCDTNLEEVNTISDEILSGYLLLKISGDSTRSAISEFVTRFGDSRFSSVCASLVEKRQVFLSLSSLENVGSENMVTVFLLQLWTKHLQGDSKEEEKVAALFDSMLGSKNSLNILARASNFDTVKDWRPAINLIYSCAYSKLEPYDHNYWSRLINSRGFFNRIVANNKDLPRRLFDFMAESSSHSTFDPEKSVWIDPENYLSISDIVVIYHNLISLECTFNLTKNFMEERKVGSNPQFWLDVENSYLDFRTKSQSFLSVGPNVFDKYCFLKNTGWKITKIN